MPEQHNAHKNQQKILQLHLFTYLSSYATVNNYLSYKTVAIEFLMSENIGIVGEGVSMGYEAKI